MDGDGGTFASVTPNVTPHSTRRVTPQITPEAVLGAIRRIADTSRRLMPSGYESLYIGMPVQDLRAVRPQHEWVLTLVSPKWSLFRQESCPPTKLNGAY